MSAPVCPECGLESLRVCYSREGTFVECANLPCHFSQGIAEQDAILAALETYRRNNPPEAA